MAQIRSPDEKKGHMDRSDQLAEKKQRQQEGKRSQKPAGEQGHRMPRS
jgi:hypothetical protein